MFAAAGLPAETEPGLQGGSGTSSHAAVSGRPRARLAWHGYKIRVPILIAVRDLAFRSKIQAAAERLDVQLRIRPRGSSLSDAARELSGGTIIADLGEPGMLEEIRAAKEVARVRVVGFLGHLEIDLARAAEEAGVDEVLSRGQLVKRMDDLLRPAPESHDVQASGPDPQ
jgi:hypothetical protein